MQDIDQLIHAQWVLPMEQYPSASNSNEVDTGSFVYKEHSVAVLKDKILDVLPTHEAMKRYRAQYEVVRPDHLVMPGLINAHTHAAMTLLRGYADDLPLESWLQDHIWPAESKWVDSEFVKVGTELAMVESLLGGVTCFNDMYFFPNVAAQVAESMGFRLNLSMPVLEFPTVWAKNAGEYLDKAVELLQAYSDHPLVTAGLGPHAPYTVLDASIEKIADIATSYDTWVHMHVHETASEVENAQREQGCRPLERLERLGVLSERFQAVHMTNLSEADLGRVKESKMHVVHCAESNLKLASGFCPVAALIEQGTQVSLGTDSAASNNDLDMFSEMRTAALLAKGVAEQASAFSAYQVLYAATQGAAQCFRMADKVGSLSKGKEADIIAIDLSDWSSQPLYNPISQVVYSVNARQVNDVWVRGKQLVQNKTLTQWDTQPLRSAVNEFMKKIKASR